MNIIFLLSIKKTFHINIIKKKKYSKQRITPVILCKYCVYIRYKFNVLSRDTSLPLKEKNCTQISLFLSLSPSSLREEEILDRLARRGRKTRFHFRAIYTRWGNRCLDLRVPRPGTRDWKRQHVERQKDKSGTSVWADGYAKKGRLLECRLYIFVFYFRLFAETSYFGLLYLRKSGTLRLSSVRVCAGQADSFALLFE